MSKKAQDTAAERRASQNLAMGLVERSPKHSRVLSLNTTSYEKGKAEYDKLYRSLGHNGHNLSETEVPPFMDSILKANDTRYGVFASVAGWGSTPDKTAINTVLQYGVPLLTGGHASFGRLSKFCFVDFAIIDSKNKQIVFWGSCAKECYPDQKEMTDKMLQKILGSYLRPPIVTEQQNRR